MRLPHKNYEELTSVKVDNVCIETAAIMYYSEAVESINTLQPT
jgi:hypothetical protein